MSYTDDDDEEWEKFLIWLRQFLAMSEIEGWEPPENWEPPPEELVREM